MLGLPGATTAGGCRRFQRCGPELQAGQAWTAYNPVDGSVLYAATTNTGLFAAVMTRTSATPLESCVPGEDLDGDGLAGCDDPDCYWACSRPSPYAPRR